MDFTDYRARLLAFHRVFITLFFVPDMNKMFTSEQLKNVSEIIIPTLRDWMANPSEEDYIPNPNIPLTDALKITELETLKKVNLGADLDTLTKQAEAVKNEIIGFGVFLKLLSQQPHVQGHKIPDVLRRTDFIRTPEDKIIYPFNYWEDCVEVYIRKYFFGNSNEKTASEYVFKTSSSGTRRAKLKLVADMLSEIEQLKKSIVQNSFPPKKLSGSKQPRIIIKE